MIGILDARFLASPSIGCEPFGLFRSFPPTILFAFGWSCWLPCWLYRKVPWFGFWASRLLRHTFPAIGSEKNAITKHGSTYDFGFHPRSISIDGVTRRQYLHLFKNKRKPNPKTPFNSSCRASARLDARPIHFTVYIVGCIRSLHCSISRFPFAIFT